MNQFALTARTGAVFLCVSVAWAAPQAVHETSHRILQRDMDAYMQRVAERRAPASARTLLSGVRGGPYDLRDTFDAYPRITGFGPLTGSTLGGQLNPDGNSIQAVAWGGIVDNAVAQSNMNGNPNDGEYNGPPGGPDPLGVRDGLLHVQRASVNDPEIDNGSGILTYQYFSDWYTGTRDRPLFVEIDLYKAGHETFQWVRPVSYTEGFLLTSILMGGYQDGGIFLPFAEMHGDPNLIEGAVVFAEPGKDSGEFALNPKIIPEHAWFTLGMLFSPDFMQVFVRDSETLADDDMDGSPDWKMPTNSVTGLRMFEEYGYGLEEGWASVYPGTLDDPMTSDVEGAGYATSTHGAFAPRLSFNGNDVAPLLSTYTIDAIGLLHGSDAFGLLPGYEIEDWWWDDYRIRGTLFEPITNPPEYQLPYVDDFERWNVGNLSLQRGRWTLSNTGVNVEVVDGVNHTPAPGSGEGAPSRSLRISQAASPYQYEHWLRTNLPTTPRARGRFANPTRLTAAFRVESHLTPLGISAFEAASAAWGFNAPAAEALAPLTEVAMGPLWTSGFDENGVGDGLVYVRQRKPIGADISGGEFDPLQPIAVAAGQSLTTELEATINTPFVNVLAAPLGHASFSLATGAWHTISLEAEPAGGARGVNSAHRLRVFLSQDDQPFIELHPNGDGSKQFTTNSLAPVAAEFDMPFSFIQGFVNTYIDDITFAGPADADTLVPLDPVYSDDPLWELPFADSLDTYERGRPATAQGYADYRLGFMPVKAPDFPRTPRDDWDVIELIAGAPALSKGDPVRVYQVESIESGSPGFGIGDFVAVSDDVPRAYDSDRDIYGVVDNGANEASVWCILDSVSGSELASGTWYLANAPGALAFDSMTMIDMGARYSYRLNPRYTGEERESEFVAAATEGIDIARGESRGDVVKLTNTVNIRDYTLDYSDPSDTIDMFNGLFPLAQIEEDEAALMSFDVYVGQATFTTGFQAVINGGTAEGGLITSISFGGLGFQSANANGGETPYLPTGNFGVLIPNPFEAPGEPSEIWQDTGVPVPTLQWLSVSVTLDEDSVYAIEVDGAELTTGLAIDAAHTQLNTTSLDTITFRRNQFGENDGLPTPGPISWSPLPFDAAASAGDYHYYRITGDFFGGIQPEPGQMLPQVWPVDFFTGAPDVDMMGMPATRPLRPNDVVALFNTDPATGQPFEHTPLGVRYEIVNGATIARGTWEHLGLPGWRGAFGAGSYAEPAGGMDPGATPPYNNGPPFDTILLGSYESVAPTTLLASDVWYVDNFRLEILDNACPGDLVSAGVSKRVVDASDLAVLLAGWGTTDPNADLDGNGVVGAGDLAILLAAWGPCDN